MMYQRWTDLESVDQLDLLAERYALVVDSEPRMAGPLDWREHPCCPFPAVLTGLLIRDYDHSAVVDGVRDLVQDDRAPCRQTGCWSRDSLVEVFRHSRPAVRRLTQADYDDQELRNEALDQFAVLFSHLLGEVTVVEMVADPDHWVHFAMRLIRLHRYQSDELAED
jgi:hypothetical protein